MNQAVLTGRVTKDIELRTTQNGKSVASFTLAVNRIPDGADFISCVAWGKDAENISRYVSKGHRLGITGRLQSRSYKDKDGKTVYVTEVVVEHPEFLEPKKSDSNDSDMKPADAPAFQPVEIDSDEDLPF